MYRRNLRCLQKDVSDWSGFRDRVLAKSQGKCFINEPLKHSVIPTMHFQQSLFRLPIPKLEDTCKRYLDSVEPIVPSNQFEKTKKIVGDFQNGEGKERQRLLEMYDKQNLHTSYITQWWFDKYLEDRTPLPVNNSPVLTTRVDPEKRDCLTRAAFWVKASVEWFNAFRKEKLLPEIFYMSKPDHYSRSDLFNRVISFVPESQATKALVAASGVTAFPLDMSQYESLFCTTRVPGEGVDKLKHAALENYIVVAHNNKYYKVEVASDDEDLTPLSVTEIYSRLKAITDLQTTKPDIDPGVFTSEDRTAWAKIRATMERDPVNKTTLDTIDKALFVLCLDTDVEAAYDSAEGQSLTAMNFLARKDNRWWDKSFSVLVTKDGSLAVNMEHSWGDGVCVLRYTVDTFNRAIAASVKELDLAKVGPRKVNALPWSYGQAKEAYVDAHGKALTRFEKELERCDYYLCVFDLFGKKDPIFKTKIKADPFMQMAMQLAWYRLNQSTVSTYESASTAAFMKGRTEAIRTASRESKMFTEQFDDAKMSAQEKAELLLKACEVHANRSKNAKMGQGVDRHLLGLKLISDGSAPDLHKDMSYQTFGSNMLSTSSLFSEALLGGGFGPVSPGYGVGYAADSDMMFFTISSWRWEGPKHGSKRFGSAIYEALRDMRATLVEAGFTKKK